jgi:hypothetical protein
MGYEHANQIPEAVRPDILEEMRLKYKDLKKSPAEHHA